MERDRQGTWPEEALGGRLDFSWSMIWIYVGNQGRTDEGIPNEKTVRAKVQRAAKSYGLSVVLR